VDEQNDQSGTPNPEETTVTSAAGRSPRANASPGEARSDRFIGHRGQASSKPRPAPTGPQGQPLASNDAAHRRGFLVVIAIAIGLGGWILYNSARAATESPETFGLGKDRFEVSRDAEKFAESVEKDGPRLYQALDGDKDLWVAYFDKKWVAFSAWPTAKGRTCPIQWNFAESKFFDCDKVEYVPGSPGVLRFQTIEEQNTLAIDLRTTIPG
jgi:hypothetical protein